MAVLAYPTPAAPVTTRVGSAHVTVAISPDPPRVGTNTVTVTVDGAAPATLSATVVRYATLMPSMNMTGPHGSATQVPGHAGVWHFDVVLGMAAPWTLRVQLSGAIDAAVNTNLLVQGSASQATTAQGSDASAWRNATFALLAVILIGAIVLWRNRRPLTIALVVLSAVLVLGLAYAQSLHGSSSMDMASMETARGSAPVPVTLVRIGGAASGTTISAPANVQPYLTQNIVARAPGLLTDLWAYTGDRLSAGQVVARLNEPELQSNAQAAQAAALAAGSQEVSAQENTVSMQADLAAAHENLRYWNAEIARERYLLQQGAVSVQEYQNERAQAASASSAYDSARAKLASASAAVQGAQAQVQQAAANAQSQRVMASYTNVVVPDDSVVMKRLVDPGVYVQPGTPILQVAVVNRLRVEAQVAQQDLAGVRIGTPIDVIFDTGKTLHGRISSVSPVVDSATHTAIAEAIVPNRGDAYQPGGFAHAVLHVRGASHRNASTVPSGAIVGGAAPAVWTDVRGAAHRISVNVLSDDGTNAQVVGDLRPGMRVIVTGADNLEEGQAIEESAQ